MLSIPEIKDALNVDFADRGLAARVQFGDYKVFVNQGADVVVLGLGSFEPVPLANFPGALTVSTTTEARLVYGRAQVVPVWVHAAPPALPVVPADFAEQCQRLTAELLHQTLRAFRTFILDDAFTWRAGKWPEPQRTEFTHGSLATFEAMIRIPVKDDELPHVDGADASGSFTSSYT